MRYADKKFCEDEQLHDIAQKFVRKILCRPDLIIETVECWKQWENIDITAKINDNIGLVIEDKVGAHLHGDQLKRYRISAMQWAENEKLELHFVYINTGNPNTDDRANVAKEGYKLISRADLLASLDEYSGNNVILLDYRERLEQFENETNAYLRLPFTEWTDRAWQGFYDWIHEIRPGSTWMKLNNMGGEFWATWWDNDECWLGDEVSIYPQIDQGRFTFKMYCETNSNREWGYRLRDELERIAAEMGVKEIHRPSRMSFKGYSTMLLVVDPEDYLGTEIINLASVERRLITYESIIAECRKRFLKSS